MAKNTMTYILNRDSSKSDLLAPQRYKNDEKFGVNANCTSVFHLCYSQFVQIIIHISGLLVLIWRILSILLRLWEHPKVYLG